MWTLTSLQFILWMYSTSVPIVPLCVRLNIRYTMWSRVPSPKVAGRNRPAIISTTSNINVMDIVSNKNYATEDHIENVLIKIRENFIVTLFLFLIFKNNGRHNLLNKLFTIPVLKLNSFSPKCSDRKLLPF